MSDVYAYKTVDEIDRDVDRRLLAMPNLDDRPGAPYAIGTELLDIVADLRRALKARETWSCERCAFTFAAYHTNQDGSTTCPMCELADAQRDLEDMTMDDGRELDLAERIELLRLTMAGIPEAYARDDIANQRDELKKLAGKVNAIRNDIVGRQSIHWSKHIYPLVAALEAAGIAGAGYDRARDQVMREIALLDAVLDADIAALPTEVRDARLALQFPDEVQHG